MIWHPCSRAGSGGDESEQNESYFQKARFQHHVMSAFGSVGKCRVRLLWANRTGIPDDPVSQKARPRNLLCFFSVELMLIVLCYAKHFFAIFLMRLV